jgi:lipopolysaccharide export system protein LptC
MIIILCLLSLSLLSIGYLASENEKMKEELQKLRHDKIYTMYICNNKTDSIEL